MCGSMADIQSPTAEIRRGKKERNNQLVHIPVIKHAMSSILNRSEQRSGLSLYSNKSLNTEMLADISADTLDK